MLQARFVLSIVIAPLLLAPATALTQQTTSSQPTDSATTTLKVTSRLTLVDVTATDSKDEPVHGLTKPDFTLEEDRKPQPIRNFEEHTSQKPATRSAQPQLPPNIFTNLQPASPTTSASNVFLFDDVATGFQNRLKAAPEYLMYARQQALKYLNTMPPGTRIAVLELSNSLRVVQNFTSDRAVLLAAINSLSYKSVPGVNLSASFPPGSFNEVCGLLNRQSQLTVNALDATAAFLAGFPGRKNVIWFTPGTPWLVNYSAFNRVPCLLDYTPQLQRDYGLLTSARASLYPIDPRGLAFCDRNCGALQTDLSALQQMARATGGVAYFNRNDLDTLIGNAITTGSDFYSLSYVPPTPKYDGQFHKIDVKVDRPGVHLEYRNGYTAIDLAKAPKVDDKLPNKTSAQSTDDLRLFMGHGAAPSTQLIFAVSVTPSTAPPKPGDPAVIGHPTAALKDKPLVRYDFQYALEPSQVTLENAADGKRTGSVVFVMTAYDDTGKVLSAIEEKTSIALNPDQVGPFLKKPFIFPEHPAEFDLPPGKIFVRIGLRDVPSQKIGTLEIPVSVTAPNK